MDHKALRQLRHYEPHLIAWYTSGTNLRIRVNALQTMWEDDEVDDEPISLDSPPGEKCDERDDSSAGESFDSLLLVEREWIIVDQLYRVEPSAPDDFQSAAAAAAAAAPPPPAAASPAPLSPRPLPPAPAPRSSSSKSLMSSVWRGVGKMWGWDTRSGAFPLSPHKERQEEQHCTTLTCHGGHGVMECVEASPGGGEGVGCGKRWVWVDGLGGEREFEPPVQQQIDRAYLHGKVKQQERERCHAAGERRRWGRGVVGWGGRAARDFEGVQGAVRSPPSPPELAAFLFLTCSAPSPRCVCCALCRRAWCYLVGRARAGW